MKKVIPLAVVAIFLSLPQLSPGQSAGGNTGPAPGGGGIAHSGMGGGLASSNSGLAPGPGTGGKGTAHSNATPPAARDTVPSPQGTYPPASDEPTTSEPPSPHAGGPISPNS
jgi:hypothetical protein